jgi:hypothetical protein
MDRVAAKKRLDSIEGRSKMWTMVSKTGVADLGLMHIVQLIDPSYAQSAVIVTGYPTSDQPRNSATFSLGILEFVQVYTTRCSPAVSQRALISRRFPKT